MCEYLDDICSYTVEHNPLDWQQRGLQQTASGYGARLTSSNLAVLPDGRKLFLRGR
jgi:hypothetical protein